MRCKKNTDVETAWVIHSRPSDAQIAQAKADGWVIDIIDPGPEKCYSRAKQDCRPEGTNELIKAWYENPPETSDTGEKGNMKIKKTFNASIKSKDSQLAKGQFEGYAAVFDNTDLAGDVIRKGAFKKTLGKFKDGQGIPCYWQHNLSDPEMNIGSTLKAWEDDHGLRVLVQLDLENKKAAYVHKLITQGRVKQMSFSYEVEKGAPVFDDEGSLKHYEILACDLFEVSVVPVGCNQQTEVLRAKNNDSQEAQETENETSADEDSNHELLSKVESELEQLAAGMTKLLELLAEPGEETDSSADEQIGNDDSQGAKCLEKPGSAVVESALNALNQTEAILER